ncbi:hypothetical protein EGW08_001950, partial [Elysia chlorotica]
MESEEDESSNSILALSGTLMSQAVNSTSHSFPTSSRQAAWLDSQNSELGSRLISPAASSFPGVEIASTNSATATLEASGNNVQKRADLSGHYNIDHQNVQYKESPKLSNVSHSSGFEVRNWKDVASKNYSWRDEVSVTAYPKLSTNSTFDQSSAAQTNRPNNKTVKLIGSNENGDGAAKTLQGTGQNRLYPKKRPNDFQNSSSNVLYTNTISNNYLGSDYVKDDFYNGNEEKNVHRSIQAHPSSTVCPADSSCEPGNSLQQVFVSTAQNGGRNPSQVPSSGNSHIQHFLKNQVDQGYTPDFVQFRSFKKQSEIQEEPFVFDPKQMEGPDGKHDFDFSFGPRSFAPFSFGSDFSPHSKSNHQFDFHQVDVAQNDMPVQTFFSTSSPSSTGGKIEESSFYNPATPSKKRMHGFEDFDSNDVGQDLRIIEQPQRKTENNSLSTTLESSLPGNYMVPTDDMTNYKHQGFGTGNQMNPGSQATSSLQYKKFSPMTHGNNSWMGRSRAHRKMARLLGTVDQSKQPSSFNDSKQMNSMTGMNNTTIFYARNPSEQSTSFSPNHLHSVRDHCNLSRDILTLEDEIGFKTGENPVDNHSRSFEDISERQSSLNRDLFTSASSTTSTPSFMYQASVLHNLSESTVSQREPEFPIFSSANTMPRDQALSNLPIASDSKNLLESGFASDPIHKDSMVPEFMMNSQHGSVVQSQQSVGCLDFASSQRDLDLSEQFAMQDPKDFGMDTQHVSEHQINLSSFEQDVNAGQPELTLSDNLTLVESGQQDINLEAYFNPQQPRDLNMSRKLHGHHGLRDITCLAGASETDFNFDDYMNSSTQRDASTAYLMQANLPQDMTICQKSVPEKIPLSQGSVQVPKQIERQPTDQSGSVRVENQEGEMSELHKELTKTSTKESVKGIRIPRDINRAMEILQSLQADEKEEHRKQQQWKQHQHQLQQDQQHHHHQEQLQHQQMMQLQTQHQGLGTALNSSPKKTFQNKHYFESLNLAMTEHQLLGAPENLIDEQAVGNFLDQSQLDIPDQSSDSLQMMQTFQNLPPSDSSEMDSMTSGQYTKRDMTQPLACELGYHILKRLALGTSLKDSEDQQASLSNMTGQPGTANLSSILASSDINSDGGSQNFGAPYYDSPKDLSNLQRQGDFEDVFKESLSARDSHLSSGSMINPNPTDSAGNRPDSDFSFVDIEVRNRLSQTKHENNKSMCGNHRAVPGASLWLEKTSMPHVSSSLNFDSVAASRKNMYNMMKTGQLCDAILSTSKERVKVHQVVLCSVSQYLCDHLQKMSGASPTASPMNSGQVSDLPERNLSFKSTHEVSVPQLSSGHHANQSDYLGSHQQDEMSLPQHVNVLLIVNCEDIKASSLQTFLVYLYLGTSDLTETNVCDLYLLACSLRVENLKDKCREFMQQMHISEEKLKVPELTLSSSMEGRKFQPELQQENLRENQRMMDKACDTHDDDQSLGGQKIYEDKAVNTVGSGIGGIRRGGAHMEVATQTDRSTTEAGVRGSQEEWVMLKKTKQKTVSPSKSKSSFAVLSKSSSMMTAVLGGSVAGGTVGGHGPHGKLQAVPENGALCGPQYQFIHKLGKKGWLSPKRRYKTELHQASKEFVPPTKDHSKVLGSENFKSQKITQSTIPGSSDDLGGQTDVLKNTKQICSESIQTTQGSSTVSVEVEPVSSKPQSNITFPMVVTKGPLVSALKTTRTTVEIAAEAAAAKVCAHSYGTRTARGATKNPISYAALASGNSKRKTLNKTNTAPTIQPDFNGVDREERKDVLSVEICDVGKSSSSDSFDKEGTKNISNKARSPLKKSNMHRASTSSINEGYTQEKTLLPLKKTANNKVADIEGCYNETGNLVDSVDSLNCKDGHLSTELHNVSRESETEDASVTQDFSVQSSSIPNPKDASQTQAPCTSSSHSQLDASPAQPIKVFPQNFRKRLIHQLNSEQNNQVKCFNSVNAEGNTNSQGIIETSSVETSSSPISVFSKIDMGTSDKYSPPIATNAQKPSAINVTTNTSPNITISCAPELQPETNSGKSISTTASKNNPLPTITSPTNQNKSLVCDQDSTEIQSTSSEVAQNALQTHKVNVKVQDAMESVLDQQSVNKITGPKHTVVDDVESQEVIKPQRSIPSVPELEEELFTHKIFMRKKKTKSRKIHNGEPDPVSLPKYKKLLIADGEASSAKPRHRKAAGGSDTEGSSARQKGRKTLLGSNSCSVTSESTSAQEDGTLPKVRAPPKKRAKMELALMKAANLARKAVDERKTEAMASPVSSPQKKHAEKEDKEEKETVLQIQAASEWKDNAKPGASLEKGEKRSYIDLHKKVAKRKAAALNKLKEKVKAKSKVTKVFQTKKKQIKSQPLVKKRKKSRTNLDEAAAIISSLALKLKSKFKEHMLSLGKKDAEISKEGSSVKIEKAKKESPIKCYSCSLCQIRLKSARRMVKHVRSHGLADDKILDTVSVEEFNQKYEACDICGYETKDKSYHYMHYHKHFRHGVPLPPGWQCDACKLCGRVFATAFQFKEHMLSHEQPLRFICWHCGQHFSSRSNFNSHVYHKHSDVRKHQCTICPKSFKTRTQLKVHLRSHTGERPFKCPDCDYSSTTRGNMKAHLKSHNYPMDIINKMITEIASRASELDAKSIDEVMKGFAEKVKKGELPSAEEKKQDTPKNGKDGSRKKQPKPKAKRQKPYKTGISAREQSNKNNISILEPQDASKVKTCMGQAELSPVVQESHIKRLLTAPLSSLTMPTFQVQPVSVEKSKEKLDLLSCKLGSNAKVASLLRQDQ